MIGKTGVIICDMCKFPCEKEVFFGGHGLIEEAVPLRFCSEECREDHMEVHDSITAEVEQRVREEFKLLHDNVCPSCVRRLQKLL